MAEIRKVPILAKNDFERMTVVLPVIGAWPAGNIAYFCSTGQSGVKEFDGTYFPTFGAYVNDDVTPLPHLDSSITLSENYFVKVSSLTFSSPSSERMQEWIYLLLRNYYDSKDLLLEFEYDLNKIRYIPDVTVLRRLYKMYKEITLIYRCLSSYFTEIWQVQLSICLSDTLNSGVWLSDLKGFADYVKSISPPYTVTDDTPVTKVSDYDFLAGNGAQCDFTSLREMPMKWYVTRSSHMHDSLYKNLQSVEMSLRIAEKLQSKGGKTRKKYRKRKSKTRHRF